MNEAVIIDIVRTPIGRRLGQLSGWHPVDLVAHAMRAVVERNDLDPGVIDDVVMGCVLQIGAQAANIGRYAVLAAGFPDTVPATTVDRQCGSSQQALHFAAQGVMAGAYDVVIAAGVEQMSLVPMGSTTKDRSFGFPISDLVRARFAAEGGLVNQGTSANLVAAKYSLDRDALDAYSVESHQRAARAADRGDFDREMVPVESKMRQAESGEICTSGMIVDRDEGIRPTASIETLGALSPAFNPDGVITAGNSSQISDGAAAALIMSADRARALGLSPRAVFRSFAVAGVDPRLMLTGPIPATRRVLERVGLSLENIDVVEVNEAFAPVVLAWAGELGADLAKVNTRGGAIALGHPLGASGIRILATLLSALEDAGGRYGLETMCEGGGLANALLIERMG